jgi:hypothetical protein
MIAIGVSFWETVRETASDKPTDLEGSCWTDLAIMHAIAFSSIIKTAKLLKVGD